MYQGSELELFQYAVGWKKYFSYYLKPHIKGSVLEVGAGIGETTRYLHNGHQAWLSLEPDYNLAKVIKNKVKDDLLPGSISVMEGNIFDLPKDKRFDTIIYIDVLEHIENDYKELGRVISHLNIGGHLIILVPAYQFLFNEFDSAIGHYRRYNKELLKTKIPSDLSQIELFYLDSMGLGASLFNKFFLKQSTPSKNQILFWDQYLIPLSKIMDILTFRSFGKSLLGVWQKQ